jgi:hypothetical protein
MTTQHALATQSRRLPRGSGIPSAHLRAPGPSPSPLWTLPQWFRPSLRVSRPRRLAVRPEVSPCLRRQSASIGVICGPAVVAVVAVRRSPMPIRRDPCESVPARRSWGLLSADPGPRSGSSPSPWPCIRADQCRSAFSGLRSCAVHHPPCRSSLPRPCISGDQCRSVVPPVAVRRPLGASPYISGDQCRSVVPPVAVRRSLGASPYISADQCGSVVPVVGVRRPPQVSPRISADQCGSVVPAVPVASAAEVSP